MFTIVRAADEATAFIAWRSDPAFAALEAHPTYGAFGRHYYPAVFGLNRRDESFAVLDGDQPKLLVSCSSGSGELDYFGFPGRFFTRAGIDTNDATKIIATAFNHIDAVAAQRQVLRITIADEENLGILSAVGKQCLNRNASATVRLTGFTELTNETGLKQGIRKSFKSLINWGKHNLEIAVVGVKNPDRDMFVRYQNFHRTIAGRITRSQESWDSMFEWITAGRGELVLGFLVGGELVTGTMVVDGATTSYYVSGVYDRDRFEQPLAHWPLWHAMLRSGERGKKLFDLGELPLVNSASPKEVAIGYFKRGFASKIATWIAWNVNVTGPTST